MKNKNLENKKPETKESGQNLPMELTDDMLDKINGASQTASLTVGDNILISKYSGTEVMPNVTNGMIS